MLKAVRQFNLRKVAKLACQCAAASDVGRTARVETSEDPALGSTP